jgi:rRNA maturation RNase YbeY
MISFLAIGVPGIYRDRSRLRAWLEHVALDHGTRIDRVAYVLMSDAELLTYNKRFLRHNDLTDVITFPYDSNNGLAGDVLMSLDRIRENARTYGKGVQDELHRVMVHGLLHLCGHKDDSPRKKAAMRALEDRWMAELPERR